MNPLEARRRLLGRNVYKRTTEGNPAIAQGSLARMYPGITMQGWTEQDSTTGANLFDKSTVIKNKYIDDSTGEMYDKAEGDTSASDYVLVRGLSYIRVTTTTFAQWMAFYDINKDFISGINGYGEPIQVPQNAEYARFTIPNPVVDTFMVNAGSELLPWEPYTGRKPSPSPDYPQEIVSSGNWDETAQKWEYEINMGGAQLFDESDIQVVSIDPEGTQRNGFEITGLKPGQYTISTKQKTIGTIGYLYANVKNSSGEYGKVQYIVTNVNINTVAISISSGDTLIIYDASTSNSAEVSKDIFSEYGIMLNIGPVALPYQPYHTPQSVTLTADRPLTKWDKLEKRNGQWGWVYKSMEITLDGSEKWLVYAAYEGFYIGYVFDTPRLRAEGFCESFICEQYNVRKDTALWLGVNNYSVYAIRIPQYNEELPDSGLQDWKDWLSENPRTILTYADEETFVPLTESEQELMNALHTFRPTTVLSNDAGCNMELTYKTKKSLGVAT